MLISVNPATLNCDPRYVPNLDLMADRSAVCAGIVRSSCGTHLLDHLAAHAAGLTRGQVAVVAVLQVDANLLGCVFTSKNWCFSLLRNAKCEKETKYKIKWIFGRNHSFTSGQSKDSPCTRQFVLTMC